MKVGFIGLGLMGGPMAKNILKAGFELIVATRTPGKAEGFVSSCLEASKEARVRAGSIADVARGSEVIVLCVTDSPDVVNVARGPDGLFSHCSGGTIIIDMSTISPEVTRDLAEEAQKKNLFWLDCPVSGGTRGAQMGTLTVFAGGSAEALEKSRPVLQSMSSRVTHFGPSGNGQHAKLANQIMTGVNLLAVCEALSYAQSVGLPLAPLREALMGGAGNSWALDVLGGKMVQGDFAPAFMVKLQQKDLRLVLGEAGKKHAPLPATALSHQMLAILEAKGRGDDGTQALFTVYQDMAGLTNKKN